MTADPFLQRPRQGVGGGREGSRGWKDVAGNRAEITGERPSGIHGVIELRAARRDAWRGERLM